MKKQYLARIGFYMLGFLILALGIILNTKAGLGVSPIISVAYSISTIFSFDFGNTTFCLYAVFVVVEMIIHTARTRKEAKHAAKALSHAAQKNIRLVLLMDLLQLPVSLIFTRFFNLFGSLIPDFETAYAGTFWGSMAGRLLVLILAIILTGIGAAMSVDVRLVPNPGDGIVQAISDTVHKGMGLCKNLFDIGCIITTTVLGFLLAGKPVGIGIGTILAMIGVGRVVALYNHLFLARMKQATGLNE